MLSCVGSVDSLRRRGRYLFERRSMKNPAEAGILIAWMTHADPPYQTASAYGFFTLSSFPTSSEKYAARRR